MNNIMNIMKEANFSLVIFIVVIVVVMVRIGWHLLKSPRKLKWNGIITLFVTSILLFGLTSTPSGAAKVKKSRNEKPSTVETGTKQTNDNEKKNKTGNTTKNQTQKSR